MKAAREIFDIPVVGMTEASVLSAAQLGDTFAVVTFTPFMTRWYEEAIATTGLGARSRGVRAARRPFANVENARKRGERDRREAEKYGGSKLARDVLPVYDALNRALDTATEEQKAEHGAFIV